MSSQLSDKFVLSFYVPLAMLLHIAIILTIAIKSLSLLCILVLSTLFLIFCYHHLFGVKIYCESWIFNRACRYAHRNPNIEFERSKGPSGKMICQTTCPEGHMFAIVFTKVEGNVRKES